MILGYKSNYDRRLWTKLIASTLVMALFLVGFVYIFLGFFDNYIVWFNYFVTNMPENGFPPSVVEELENLPNDDFFMAIYFLGKHVLTLSVIFAGGLWLFVHFGFKTCFYVTTLVCNALNLYPMMKLSFIKVNPSKFDSLIRWLNK